jgi:hypothetical protein
MSKNRQTWKVKNLYTFHLWLLYETFPTDTASFLSFVDLYIEFDDSGQISTKIYEKRDDFHFFVSPCPVACFSDEDDASGNQNNCYWPLHSESIVRYKHHMQEKLVYCCTYLEYL